MSELFAARGCGRTHDVSSLWSGQLERLSVCCLGLRFADLRSAIAAAVARGIMRSPQVASCGVSGVAVVVQACAQLVGEATHHWR